MHSIYAALDPLVQEAAPMPQRGVEYILEMEIEHIPEITHDSKQAPNMEYMPESSQMEFCIYFHIKRIPAVPTQDGLLDLIIPYKAPDKGRLRAL